MMRAVEVAQPGAELLLVQKEVPTPGDDDVLIKVEACGICHGDALPREGRFPGLSYPRVPGHEVVGRVEQVGSAGLRHWSRGERVGLGWHAGHCFKCPPCLRGDFGACEHAQVTGLSVDGGYAEYVVARSEVLVPIPEELTALQAAPLLCAGRTTLGALLNSGARGGDLVGVVGLGGLGHLAVQYARKLGFHTVALSRGKSKEALAYELGAQAYIDTTGDNPAQELQALGGARVILCTAPDSQTVSRVIGGLGVEGRLVIVSFPGKPIEVNPFFLMTGGRSISGSVAGSVEDALRFSVLTQTLPLVEEYPLEQAPLAFERMMTAEVRFRAVLNPTL